MNHKDRLVSLIKQIHEDCFKLCKIAVGDYLPIAGNIGIFCQTEADYVLFTKLKEEITEQSTNPNQKYFKLKQTITIPPIKDIPETVYEYLYIRKPASDTPQLGDIDFLMDFNEYNLLKEDIIRGDLILGAEIYNRPGWDMIELRNDFIYSLAYITYKEMAEKVRFKFD